MLIEPRTKETPWDSSDSSLTLADRLHSSPRGHLWWDHESIQHESMRLREHLSMKAWEHENIWAWEHELKRARKHDSMITREQESKAAQWHESPWWPRPRGSSRAEASWPVCRGTPAGPPRRWWSPSGGWRCSEVNTTVTVRIKVYTSDVISFWIISSALSACTCKCSSSSRIAATFPHLRNRVQPTKYILVQPVHWAEGSNRNLLKVKKERRKTVFFLNN